VGDNGWLAGNVRTRILASRLPSWQWVLVALALPVATCAAPPGGAEERPAPVRVDGHAGVDWHHGGLQHAMFFLDRDKSETYGLDQVLRLRRRDLPGGSRLGDHVPAGRAAYEEKGLAPRTCGRSMTMAPRRVPAALLRDSGSWSSPVSGSPPTAPCWPGRRSRLSCRRVRGQDFRRAEDAGSSGYE
jgi:hypothetical protein